MRRRRAARPANARRESVAVVGSGTEVTFKLISESVPDVPVSAKDVTTMLVVVKLLPKLITFSLFVAFVENVN